MEHPLMDYVNSSEPEGDAFICAECGDGFRRYLDLLKHMTIHQRLRTHEQTDSFSLVGLPNGFQGPREYALHENGTFMVVDRSGQSNIPSFVKPSSSTPSSYQNSKPIVLISKPAKTDLHVNTLSHSQYCSISPLKQYRCETCGKLFNNQLSLQRHQQYRNLEQGFKCTLCCKIFEDKERLRKHLQEHAHERFYCCGHCGKRFLKRETLYAHQKERHRLLGLRKKSDNGQENIVHKTYPCKKCKLCFFWLSDLQSHLLSHSKEKTLFVNTSSNLKQSLKDEQSHTIEYCNSTPTDVTKQYSSGTSTDVNKPYRSGTPTDVTKPYRSGTPTDVTRLTRQYNNGTPTEVTRQYNSDAAIDVKTHNDKSDSKTPSSFRPYRCGLCGDRFQQLTDLKEHHLTHQTQEEIDKLKKESESQRVVKRRRRYSGIECIVTQAPARKGGRPPLYKKGSGAKVHPCKHCHRVFSHSSSLSRHNRYHKGTLHTCVLCGKHFPQRCDVRRHIAMYHKPELEKKPSLKYLALHSKPEGGSQLNSDLLEENTSFTRNPKKSLDNVGAEFYIDNGEEQQTGSPGEASTAPKARGNYKCDECGKRFGLLCVYQRHLRYHKREPGSEMVKCPRCPSRFRSSSALERHLENHPSQSGGETDMEGQSSPTADSNHDPDMDTDHDNVEDLEGQGDIDMGEKSGPAEVLYECTECTETFSSLQKFLKHQSSHGSDNLG
ncbi:zinc finger protein Xfin [Esox lucius]|uniref:C2H2-type domain-containing protein n=1 Tax=Esox lucius TaxID=8010 RepID=A0A3P9AHE2_ESOLU|nr:zinc finger protein Xfin [Esox lucius]XP_019896695.1 zinc finger protein Xfin [Esox lucius]